MSEYESQTRAEEMIEIKQAEIDRLESELLRLCGPTCPHDGKRAIEHSKRELTPCDVAHHKPQPRKGAEHVCGKRGCGMRVEGYSYIHGGCGSPRTHPDWTDGKQWLATAALLGE